LNATKKLLARLKDNTFWVADVIKVFRYLEPYRMYDLSHTAAPKSLHYSRYFSVDEKNHLGFRVTVPDDLSEIVIGGESYEVDLRRMGKLEQGLVLKTLRESPEVMHMVGLFLSEPDKYIERFKAVRALEAIQRCIAKGEIRRRREAHAG
jgi:hypothetical protein